ncbi:MAG: WD40 repeat domain-containing protein, partial [bacterium]|nr:WD40 repeat domain-containing protein [bacterium]
MRRLLIVLALLAAVPARGDEPILVIDSGGHTAVITDVVFTRDGRQLVSAGKDKVVRVWDIENGAVVRTIRGEIGPGPEGKIYAAALSPDERVLAVGGWLAGGPSQSRAVRLHDFRTGQVLGLLEGHENVILDLAFSPDGRTLASGSADDTVRLWDVTAKKSRHVLPGHTDDVYAIALSPDGERLASGSYDHTVRLWDVASGELLRELTDHEDKVRAASFSPDG